MLTLFILILLVEDITEILIKSSLLSSPREYLIQQHVLLSELLSCGFCFSFWVSLIINIGLSFSGSQPEIFQNSLINFLSLVLIVHRGSNIWHGIIDRYFDTRKDIRYNR